MDQIRIGCFLKELRKEKNLTQEQLAEKLGVARRTVSRWETGYNLPDMDIFIELSDYYGVELRELLDGERRNENVNAEMKETVMKVAEYGNVQKEKLAKVSLAYFILGIVALIINQAMRFIDLPSTFWVGFLEGATAGMAMVAMVFGILYVTGAMSRIKDFKMRLLEKKENGEK